jgi:hypothetical protein
MGFSNMGPIGTEKARPSGWKQGAEILLRQFKSEVRIFALKRPRKVSDSLKPYGDDEYQDTIDFGNNSVKLPLGQIIKRCPFGQVLPDTPIRVFV